MEILLLMTRKKEKLQLFLLSTLGAAVPQDNFLFLSTGVNSCVVTDTEHPQLSSQSLEWLYVHQSLQKLTLADVNWVKQSCSNNDPTSKEELLSCLSAFTFSATQRRVREDMKATIHIFQNSKIRPKRCNALYSTIFGEGLEQSWIILSSWMI